MSHAEQLEQETEQTRAQIADTLDELRASMTPGHVLDQLTDRFTQGAGAAFAQNLKDQTVRNPIPIALLGVSLVWLMLGARGSSGDRFTGERLRNRENDRADDAGGALDAAGQAGSDAYAASSEKASRFGKEAGDTLSSGAERARQAGNDAVGTIRSTAGSAADAVQQGTAQAADRLRASAASASDSMQRTASSIAEDARRAAGTLSDSTKAAGQRTLQSGSALLDFCREQPMVTTGLGLVLGAVIGALLPASETEDRLMGESSDRVKDRAQNLATEQYETAKETVKETAREAANEAAKTAGQHGLDANETDTRPDKEQKPDQSKDEQHDSSEVKADHATLVPSEQSELERRGQPWTADNAPI
jgi:ElaB/YqjD/DUF883 family membrane-anchored ribosome-binding protein